MRREKYVRRNFLSDALDDVKSSRDDVIKVTGTRHLDSRITALYSRSERMDYYDMLSKNREMKKMRKKMRKVLRNPESISVEADGFSIQGSMDTIFSIASDFLFPCFSEADSEVDKSSAQKALWRDQISAAILNRKKDKDPDSISTVWEQISSWLPSDLNVPWLGYLLIVAVSLYRSKSKADDVVLLAQYCLVLKLSGKSLEFLDLIMPIIATQRFFFRKNSVPEESIRTEALSDVLFKGRSDCADFISSHFMMSVREIVLIIASYHLFPKSIAKHLFLWLGKVDKPRSLPEAMSKITTDVANLIRMGESVARGNPISEVFLTSDPVLAAKAKSQELMYSYNHIYYGLPTPEGVDSVTWISEARKVVDTIKQFSKTVNPYDIRLSALNIAGLDLTKKLLEVNAKRHRTRRMTPFLIIVCGPPGIGKSTIITWVCQLWSRVMGREFQQTHVFEKNPQSEYNDGYVPGETPIIHISEIGALTQKLAEAGMEKGVFELTSIVDSLPYAFNMSDVKDKGVTFCIPEMVCVDTNNAELNLKFLVQNPSAYKRRGVYLVPTVKPGYRISNDSCMLDGSKDAADYMDKWTFSMYRHRPISNVDTTKEFMLQDGPNDDIYRLYDVLKAEMERHVATESAVLERSLKDWCLNYEKNGPPSDRKDDSDDKGDDPPNASGPSDPPNDGAVSSDDEDSKQPPPAPPASNVNISNAPPPIPPPLLPVHVTPDVTVKRDKNGHGILGWGEDVLGVYKLADFQKAKENFDVNNDWSVGKVLTYRYLPAPFVETISYANLTLSQRNDLIQEAWNEHGFALKPDIPVLCNGCAVSIYGSRNQCYPCEFCQIINVPIDYVKKKSIQSAGDVVDSKEFGCEYVKRVHRDESFYRDKANIRFKSLREQLREDRIRLDGRDIYASDEKDDIDASKLLKWPRYWKGNGPKGHHVYPVNERPRTSVIVRVAHLNSKRNAPHLGNIRNTQSDVVLSKRILGKSSLLCDCCPDGIHRVTRFKRFLTASKIFGKISLRISQFFSLLAFSLISEIPELFAQSDSAMRFILAFFISVFWMFVPYSVWISLLFGIVFGIICVLKYYFGKGSFKRIMFNAIRRELSYSLSDMWNFCRRRQTLMIEASVVMIALYSLSKIIPLIWKSDSKGKRVESSFRTLTPSIDDLAKKEIIFGMKAPATRIRSKLGAMTYENVISTVNAPLARSGTFEEFCARHERNVRPIQVITYCPKGKIVSQKAYGFGIKGVYMLIPLHMFCFEEAQSISLMIAPDKYRRDNEGNFVYSIRMDVRKEDVHFVKSDVGLIKVSGTQFKDFLKFFPSENMKMKQHVTYISDYRTFASDAGSILASDDLFNRVISHEGVMKYDWPEHAVGACGYPLFTCVNDGYFITGFHIAGDKSSSSSYGIKLDQVTIQRALNSLVSKSFEVLSRSECEIKVDAEVESRSFTHFVETGPVEVHGKIHAFNGNQKTNIVKSAFGMRDDFADTMLTVMPEAVTTSFAPASMRPTKSGSPITNGAIKLCKQRKPVDKTIMDRVVDIVSAKIISNLERLGVKRNFSPIDIDTVLNGHIGDYLSRSVDLSKSGGFGYPGKKKDHVYIFDINESNRYVQPREELAWEVNAILDGYMDGFSSNPVFKAALKDEVRPVEKVRAHKTRVFYATPFPFLIVQKAFMSPLYTLMIEHGEAFYAALGVDMHRQGQLIRENMMEFCEERKSCLNMGEGDYGGFDTSMPYEIGEAACEVSYRILQWMGYNDIQLKIVSGILTDLLYPRVDYFGDLLTVPGLQPSGKYATAEDNSLRNLLILTYSWYSTPCLADLDFFDHVNPLTYGDDMLAAITDDVANDYNNITIARSCESIGLEFTSSSKSAVLDPFVPFDQISFLKRTFAYHEDLRRYVSRLSLDSIYKILEYLMPTSAVPEHVQYDGMCRSALIEFFFWTDRSGYNSFKSYIVKVLNESFPGVQFNLPSYDALCDDYRL